MPAIDWIVTAARPLRIPKFRLLDPLLPKTGTRRCWIHGASMDLDLSDLIQRRIYIGCYERDESDMFRAKLVPGNVVVDVGANVGYFTALSAELVGTSGKVYSVEPNPTAFAKLNAMVAESKMTQCTALNVGLSAEPGTLTLYEPPSTGHNLNSSMSPIAGGTPIPVPVRTLDDCLDEWKVTRVDLLKIDVEGYELNVLRGATRALQQKVIKGILLEFHDYWLRQAGSTPAELWRYLIDAGFHLPGGSTEMPPFPSDSMPTHYLTSEQ